MIRVLVVFVIACGGGESPPQVGAMCDLAGSPNEIAVVTPAPGCAAQICLHILSSTPDLCSARCEIAEDCVAIAGSPCTAGFECVPVLSVGPFACEKLCVCADRAPATSCP